VLRLINRSYKQDLYPPPKRLFRLSTDAYWVVVSASAFACAICYGLTPKPDATAIQALTFVNGVVAVMNIIADRISLKRQDTQTKPYLEPKRFSRVWKTVFAVVRNLNRLLKFVRFALSILFIAGAAQLARQYHFKNPYDILHSCA
jgi:hypothetical protein